MQHFSLKLYSLNNSDCGGEPLPVKSRQPGEKYEVKLNWRNILFLFFWGAGVLLIFIKVSLKLDPLYFLMINFFLDFEAGDTIKH